MRERLVERAAREAERGGGDRGAEDVERLHRQLEALARRAEPLRRRECGSRSNSRRASGCGAMTSMRSAIVEPGASASTTNALMPFAPGASVSRANTL